MLERDVVAAIKKYLASLGSDVFFWKEHKEYGQIEPTPAKKFSPVWAGLSDVLKDKSA